MVWRTGRLADFFEDYVVYRNLEPQTQDIPGLSASWQQIGLLDSAVPRKTSPEYARTLAHFLRIAQEQRGLAPLRNILFIGDTMLNDGGAARNVGSYWPVRGFIGADRLKEPAICEIKDVLMVANRWGMLADFWQSLLEENVPCDERTALLIDLDKTSLGARGRNDQVIDGARVSAVERTMRAALGDTFDKQAFLAVYNPLNQPTNHHVTADNQDYLAYVCLMVAGDVIPVDELWKRIGEGAIASIDDVVALCDGRRSAMSLPLLAAHEQVQEGIAQNDPTPFKEFRRGEYLETVARMNVLGGDASEKEVLNSEIVITGEVASLALHLKEQGVLVFGISDKPDEASTPTPELALEGNEPIHRTVMKIYGNSVI